MTTLVRCAAALTLASAMIACQTEVVARPSNARADLQDYFGPDDDGFRTPGGRAAGAATATGGGGRPVAATQPAAAGLNDADETCAANLEEITGSLLAYYSVHQQLPAALESVPRVSPSGIKISLTCPVSGKRYVYRPDGLRSPVFIEQNGESRVAGILILYDPEPSHQTVLHLTDGTNDYDAKKSVHLGIVVAPPPPNPRPNQPVQMSVERIEPGILAMYLRHNAPPTTAPTPHEDPRKGRED
jgi:hypothetical protein